MSIKWKEKKEAELHASFAKFQSAPSSSPHLELSVRGEDADPSVVIVGHHYVAIKVHSDAGGSLQLSWRATSDPEPHLELAIVGKNLIPTERVIGVESQAALLGSTVMSLTCMHWLLLSATTTLPLLEVEIPCRFVNSPFSRPREPKREQQHTEFGSLPVSNSGVSNIYIFFFT